MQSKLEWSKEVTPQLRQRMLSSADECYENGCGLLLDAETLHRASRWSTAVALAVLAEEEFSKAFILRVCSRQGRWDSTIHGAMRKHSDKQAVSQAMRAFLDHLIRNALRVEELNRFGLTRSRPDMLLSRQYLDPILHSARQSLAQPHRDRLKQDALYVNIDKDGRAISTPKKVDDLRADECIREAGKLKAALDLMAGDPTAIELWR